MLKHTLRGITAAAGATVLAVAMAAPASAATRYFADEPGDTGGAGDITVVKVANSSEGNTRIGVRAQVGEFSPGDSFTVWFDTRRSDRGPEYKVDLVANSDAFGLARVETFRSRGTAVRCSGLRVTADALTAREIAISVPRSCMGSPRKVRVSLKAQYLDADGAATVDWAPAQRTFFGSVSR